ncbi:TlpA disulfide reductase family protein [Daejeonella sp.]|uniref:TlpA family protein disulfide reductase n=1 Tax=Daejeonella sp. TaxID=2805397 RepID=UPI0027302856|nr:TlpA disulfide reductase family protein [Daejeonella sp.]MDP2415409.1 TlpA disulfide reductase family protein [Daejeonella sp.]
MNIIKSIKSNIGFIIALIFFAIIVINPDAKALLMRGLMKTGLFAPDVSNLQPKPAGTTTEPAGPVAPPVSFTSLDGKTLDLASLKGKVVFINFWATWCPPCVAEMPSVNSLFNKMKNNDNVVFIMVDVENKLKSSEAFMKKNKYDLPVYAPAAYLPEELFTGSLPTTVIINKNGEIIFKHEGMADYNSGETEKLLNDLSK